MKRVTIASFVMLALLPASASGAENKPASPTKVFVYRFDDNGQRQPVKNMVVLRTNQQAARSDARSQPTDDSGVAFTDCGDGDQVQALPGAEPYTPSAIEDCDRARVQIELQTWQQSTRDSMLASFEAAKAKGDLQGLITYGALLARYSKDTGDTKAAAKYSRFVEHALLGKIYDPDLTTDPKHAPFTIDGLSTEAKGAITTFQQQNGINDTPGVLGADTLMNYCAAAESCDAKAFQKNIGALRVGD